MLFDASEMLACLGFTEVMCAQNIIIKSKDLEIIASDLLQNCILNLMFQKEIIFTFIP
jgi:hypothetical protein